MRDTMPQPTKKPKTYKAMFYEGYEQAWSEARGHYLGVTIVCSVVSTTLGAIVGYYVAGGFG